MAQPSRESALRDQLATAGRILAQEGQGHLVYGHLSARRDVATFLVKPAGIGLEELTPDSLVVMDHDGGLVSGAGRLHQEMHIHTALYAARPEVEAVVHTHAAEAVIAVQAWPEARRPHAYSQDEAAFLPAGIGRYESAAMITSPEQGHALATALANRRAAVLDHHGLVTIGAGVAEATVAAVLLVRALRLRRLSLGLAAAAGRVAEPISEVDSQLMQEGWRKASVERERFLWGYLVRRLAGFE